MKEVNIPCENCNHKNVCENTFDPYYYSNCEYYEEPRPHGTWVDVPKYPGFYVCSNCLKKLDGDFERFDHWEMKKDNFCSVCGSDNRKRGEVDAKDPDNR